MANGRILTGIRPTGKSHLGHFVGAFENWVRLQDDYECFFLIADMHTLTTRSDDTSHLQTNILELSMDLLAVGIDPNRSTICLQSMSPEVAELALYFGMLISVPRLQRVPTLKEVMDDLNIETASYGLLGYPVLQTADILLPRANLVPVGRDQESHIEISREIARRFNNLYGDVFPEPQALIGRVGTLVGTDGQAKMSKSIGNAIMLSDAADEVDRKVRTMYTDPNRLRATDPGRVEGNPVFIYHEAFNDDPGEVADLADRYRNGKVGDVEVKKRLGAALNRFLDPIRERRAAYERKPDEVREIILEGSKRAHSEAIETMRRVRDAMGLTFARS